MFFSLSTWLYDRLSFSEAAFHVKKTGYHSIELSGYHWVTGEWTVEEVARECERQKIAVTSVHCNHHTYPIDHFDWDTYRRYHEKLYQSLERLGNIIVVEHGLDTGSKYANQTQKQTAFLKELSRAHGLVLSFENVPSTVFQRPDHLEGLFDEALGFTFDIAHSAYIDVEPMEFAPYFNYLVNTHVYDVIKGAGLGDWAPVSTGQIDWARFIDELKKQGYSGPLTVELNEDNFVKVLQVYKKIISPELSLDVADRCAVYSREQLEKLL